VKCPLFIFQGGKMSLKEKIKAKLEEERQRMKIERARKKAAHEQIKEKSKAAEYKAKEKYAIKKAEAREAHKFKEYKQRLSQPSGFSMGGSPFGSPARSVKPAFDPFGSASYLKGGNPLARKPAIKRKKKKRSRR